MEIKERKDWNVYKQIFFDNWEGFKKKYPLFDKKYYDDLLDKMLKCGDPDQIGYIEYRSCIAVKISEKWQ